MRATMPTQTTRGRGRPAHEPTDALREKVVKLRAGGHTLDYVAFKMDLSTPTLVKHYEVELERGAMLGKAVQTERLHKLARAGNLGAIIWLDKTRYDTNDKAPREEPLGKKEQVEQEAARAHEDSPVWSRVLQ
jgi:hypothetical protein